MSLVKSKFVRVLMAEFAGTFLLLAFGNGCVAQFILGRGTKGDFFSGVRTDAIFALVFLFTIPGSTNEEKFLKSN